MLAGCLMLQRKVKPYVLLETPRLIVVSTPLEVIQQRLQTEQFTCQIASGSTSELITFPAEWPGDALVMFPMMADHYNPDDWGGTVIERASRTAIGQIGTKGQPDEAGRVEIGYGMNPASWGQGYATEAVGALVAFLLAQPTVRTVTAETLPDNIGSIRVLEKLGFVRIGERFDEADGDLILWERQL